MKPMLCRLCAYFAPGLPRPTKSRMTRHPARYYFFLSPPAGAFAPAAGALAPAAGAFAPAAAGAAAPAVGAAPGAAAAAGPAAAAAAAALISSAEPGGGTMGTRVASSRDSDLTPVGSLISDRCSE